MPVKPFVQSRSSDYQELVDELYCEWKNPNPAAAEPVILEEVGPDQNLAHVYVVWGKWSHIDRIERGEIIMEAAQKKLLPRDLLGITIAMGLTPQEAVHMGIMT